MWADLHQPYPSIHMRCITIMLHTVCYAAYTKQIRQSLSVPRLCASDDISSYIEISVIFASHMVSRCLLSVVCLLIHVHAYVIAVQTREQ